MHSFFFRELQLITVLLLILSSYTSWSTKLISLVLCVGFSIFYTVLLSSCFCSTKSNGSLTLKRHNFFQNKTNGKATRSFTPSLLIFKLQQKVWKFNDICLSWSSPETDLETNF